MQPILLITNLLCNALIMKFLWNLFIHEFVHLTHKHVWHTNKCVDEWNMNLWMNECHTNFISFNKFVCQIVFQCTILMSTTYKLWMD
jgi:hypothetical protein